MKIVSNEYKDSMNSILRGQSLVKVLFSNVNTTASSDGEWDDNDEHVSYSEFDTVNYEYDYGATYSTLELNRWLLNGTQRMLGEVLGIQEGFVSNILSDEEGEYTNKPIIIREFENHHAIPGLTINFDTVEKDYPLQLSVYYYYQGQLVDTQVVSVKDTMVTVACGADEVDKIEIEVDRMLPYRRIRIERIQFGLEVVFGMMKLYQLVSLTMLTHLLVDFLKNQCHLRLLILNINMILIILKVYTNILIRTHL